MLQAIKHQEAQPSSRSLGGGGGGGGGGSEAEVPRSVSKRSGEGAAASSEGLQMSITANFYALQQKLRPVLQKVPSEANPKVRNHGEGPY